MPSPPVGHKIQVVPDWVCEIFSPSTKSTDREEKMPLYAHYGIQLAWLVDPKTKTLEAYELVNSQWQPLGLFRNDDIISVKPFDAIDIHDRTLPKVDTTVFRRSVLTTRLSGVYCWLGARIPRRCPACQTGVNK
ncbi:Uma2 family endonuclease [Nitrosococcus halophilus]|uniref:Uma2 family endonuclease n=1 Tax=Nitrosococcus halophilus TaxID=133539 RepID=UPI0002E28B16